MGIRLGNDYEDAISGFAGVAVGRASYLNGCVSVQLESRSAKKDGEPVTIWLDEQRLTDIGSLGAVLGEVIPEAVAGGPQSRPPDPGMPRS